MIARSTLELWQRSTPCTRENVRNQWLRTNQKWRENKKQRNERGIGCNSVKEIIEIRKEKTGKTTVYQY